ncbi:MAG: helix-turn-helix domain-containing protein [Thermomicrobiales bacterium]|nr:helix-turn-helix domain-containing protein [Thermomicrobiales bacterium]
MNQRESQGFGETLRRLREQAGYSQEELAQRSGLSARGISDLERGVRTTPRLETVRMLADGLALDEADLAELLAVRNIAPTDAPRLPNPATSFIGRVTEIEEIGQLLTDPNVRLVTLTGPGGVGKTRVALRVAEALVPHFDDGAVFFYVATISNASDMISAIAGRLGVPDQPHRTLSDGVILALRSKRMLMVLDNLEQIPDAGIIVGELIGGCPDLTILATSRALLRVAAEHVYPVWPMDVDADSDAVTLFVSRARTVDPGFVAVPELDVAIVRRLEGLPLGIELAAARVRHLSRSALLQQLDQQLNFLSEGHVDTPARHQTMRNTIAWSYGLLTEDARRALRWLALLPSGVSLETAEALFGASYGLNVVTELIDSSLLIQRSGVDGIERYVMLQIVREYGLEQLDECRERVEAISAIHEAWCEPFARRIEFLLSRPQAPYWLNRVEAEYQNLSAHIRGLISLDRYEDALDVASAMASYQGIRGKCQEGRDQLGLLLNHPACAEPSLVRTRGLIFYGILCNHLSDGHAAKAPLEEATTLSRSNGNLRYEAFALMTRGITAWLLGDMMEAEALVVEARQIAETIDDSWLIASAAVNLGAIAGQRGQMDVARRETVFGRDLANTLGDVWLMGVAEANLAWQADDLDVTEAHLDAAWFHLLELRSYRDLPVIWMDRSNVARLRGDLTEAKACAHEALEMARSAGDVHCMADAMARLGRLAYVEGMDEDRRKWMSDAAYWFEQSTDRVRMELYRNAIEHPETLVDIEW